ncbi:hypothetical protein AOLI_G00250540 [Acnodon oligacanthus]
MREAAVALEKEHLEAQMKKRIQDLFKVNEQLQGELLMKDEEFEEMRKMITTKQQININRRNRICHLHVLHLPTASCRGCVLCPYCPWLTRRGRLRNKPFLHKQPSIGCFWFSTDKDLQLVPGAAMKNPQSQAADDGKKKKLTRGPHIC